jgi:hypothetical protein
MMNTFEALVARYAHGDITGDNLKAVLYSIFKHLPVRKIVVVPRINNLKESIEELQSDMMKYLEDNLPARNQDELDEINGTLYEYREKLNGLRNQIYAWWDIKEMLAPRYNIQLE